MQRVLENKMRDTYCIVKYIKNLNCVLKFDLKYEEMKKFKKTLKKQ